MAGEAPLLPIVHLHHAFPIGPDLGKTEVLAEVNQVENVLLEARSAKPYRSLEKLRSDAGVLSDGVGHLVDVRPRGFAESGDRVDRRNTLREKGIGDQFGKFGRPQVRHDDFLAGHPAGVNIGQFPHGGLTLGRALPADEDAIGILQVGHRGTLREKLGIRKNLEVTVR